MTSKPTDAQRLAVQPPDPSRHDEMLDLIAKTFSNWHGYWPFLNYCRGGYLDKSHYDPKVSRIGLLDGRIVTNWTVYDYQMRIGRCSVRVGGVGVVSTHGEFRKRGLMVPTGMGSIQAMRDSGYDLTLLFGLHNFYHHFSYVRAFTEQSYTIAAAELPAGKAPALRKFDPPRKDLESLYNRASQGLTGTAVRPTFPLARPMTGNNPPPTGFFWTGKTARPVGYVVIAKGQNHLDCSEAVGEPGVIFAVLAKLAAEFHVGEVRLSGLHYDSPLARAAMALLPARVPVRPQRLGHGANDQPALDVDQDRAELSRRLAASHLCDFTGRLVIADLREQVALDISGGRVSVAERTPSAGSAIRGGEQIAQLIMGTDEPFEIVEAARIRLAGQAKQLLPILFPNQHPMLASWDRF